MSEFTDAQKALAQANLDTVLANGFDPPTWENLPIKVMLVITEISEAIESAHSMGDDPMSEELADIWIRISGILAALWGSEWAVRYGKGQMIYVFAPIEVLLWPIARHCCNAVECWRHEKRDDTRMELEFAIKQLAVLAYSLDIDLTTEIEMKMRKNSKRAKFHGKAKSSG